MSRDPQGPLDPVPEAQLSRYPLFLVCHKQWKWLPWHHWTIPSPLPHIKTTPLQEFPCQMLPQPTVQVTVTWPWTRAAPVEQIPQHHTPHPVTSHHTWQQAPQQHTSPHTLFHLSFMPTTLAEQKPRPKTPQQIPLQHTHPGWHYYEMVTSTLANHTLIHHNLICRRLPFPTLAKYTPPSTQTAFPRLPYTSLTSTTLTHHIPPHPFNFAKPWKRQAENQGSVTEYFGQNPFLKFDPHTYSHLH